VSTYLNNIVQSEHDMGEGMINLVTLLKGKK
jgi:hypothetical protein